MLYTKRGITFWRVASAPFTLEGPDEQLSGGSIGSGSSLSIAASTSGPCQFIDEGPGKYGFRRAFELCRDKRRQLRLVQGCTDGEDEK